MTIFATTILSMYITIILIPFFNRLSYKLNLLDTPNDRKVHLQSKARSGGIAMALGIFPPLFFWLPVSPFFMSLFIGAGIIVTFGIIDDFKGLNYKIKFLGQFLASIFIVLYGGVQIKSLGGLFFHFFDLPEWLSIAVTVIIIVGVTNAINLSDGLDGLAGGISLVSFICIGYLGFCFDNITIVLCSVAVIGSIFGFLRYNSYPSVLFMGDTGSQLLGFLSITLSIFLTQTYTPLSPVLPLLIIGFPILDTITVMSSRIASGRSPFKADNRHFHHRLMKIGLFHSEAVLVIYFLQSFFVLSAFIFRFNEDWFLLNFYIISSGVILVGFYVASKFELKLTRQTFFDTFIKGRLRILKEINLLIKISFNGVKFLFPLLLLFTCFIPDELPLYFSMLSIILLSIFLITWKLNLNWMGLFSGILFYFFIPILVYLGETNSASWAQNNITNIHAILFAVLLLFTYLTLKFTRRKKGFKTTPLDFLILFIVLVIPHLPDPRIQNLNLGFSAVKIIVFYLGFEVLIGELRNKANHVEIMTVLVLSIIGMRGFIG
jgi:UDP-GlcNAc:undecaprenyl-phosphate/decaprenyl-phosphate GlcNAc-1-phosphate transferase